MIDLFLVRGAAALVASAAGAYTDYKTGLIYDYITYPLIALGVLLNLFEPNPFLALSVGVIVFLIGLALYHLGKLGGGDVKLFTGLAFILPFYGSAPFIVNVLFFSALTAVVFFGIYYLLKYIRSGIDFQENREGIKRSALLSVFVGAYFVYVSALGWLSGGMLLVLVPLVLSLLFLAFEKGIRKQFFLKSVALKDLEEDEPIAWDFLDGNLQKSLNLKLKRVIGEQEKRRLAQLGLKEVLVYRELPRFGPFIFVGVVLTLLMPDFFSLLLA